MNGFLWNGGIFGPKISKQKLLTFYVMTGNQKEVKVTVFPFSRTTVIMPQNPPLWIFSGPKFTYFIFLVSELCFSKKVLQF